MGTCRYIRVARFCRGSLAAFCLAGCGGLAARTYEVGLGKAFRDIGQVPWESLEAGDTVLIGWRPEPYREKWVMCRQGRPDAPITVRGVAGPTGQLPVIDGSNATTRAQLDYWGRARGLIKIGGARVPADLTPQYIVVENLEIRNARPPFAFSIAQGKRQPYQMNAAAIHVEKGVHVTIRNCVIHDCGNGLFVSSNDQQASRDIRIERNYIFDNGNAGSGYEHNAYSEGIGVTYEFNRFGPLRARCAGNNLKDRSAGLVLRYNWIEGGNQELDLVDAEDSALVRDDPQYRDTFVYGNVIIQRRDSIHAFVVHYGGDGREVSNYRNGTLYFYNNTVVSLRTDYSILFRLSSGQETCDCWNNIIYAPGAPGTGLIIMQDSGMVNLRDNWLSQGWRPSLHPGVGGIISDGASSISGNAPGFVDMNGQDYHLTAASPCGDRGVDIHAEPFRSHPVDRQYVRHQSDQARVDGGKCLGAFGVESGR